MARGFFSSGISRCSSIVSRPLASFAPVTFTWSASWKRRSKLRPAVEQHELVMAFRILRHEEDARPGAACAAVADDEPHDAGIEADHAVEVGGMDAEVGELSGEGHGFLRRPERSEA